MLSIFSKYLFNEWMDGWMDGWMNGWKTLLNYG
jgi:hypothetical protein